MAVRRILAASAILVGGLGTILSLFVAFGVDISPDQHTAILGVASLILLAVGTLLGQDELASYRAEKATAIKR